MSHTIYFISHPNVVISATVPVTQWPLSEIGRQRMQLMLDKPWVKEISAIYCSDEQKAIDGAQILSEHLSIPYTAVNALGENDRSSTGFLEPAEFETTADEFFTNPDVSIRGWETASAAQQRIVASVSTIDKADASSGAIAIISHGAVGTLLHCHCENKAISRRWDQPANGGGNFMKLNLGDEPFSTCWSPIDT